MGFTLERALLKAADENTNWRLKLLDFRELTYYNTRKSRTSLIGTIRLNYGQNWISVIVMKSQDIVTFNHNAAHIAPLISI